MSNTTDGVEPVRRRLLSMDEAVEYLGGPPITAQTVRNLVRNKKLAHVKVGRVIGFTTEALEAYIDAHTVPVVENPWGLSDGALRNLRAGRRERG